MKTFLKIGLILVAVVVAIKLLPAALVLGGVVAGVAALLALAGFLTASGLLGAGLLLTLLLTPIWLPVLVVMGLIALARKICGRPVAA